MIDLLLLLLLLFRPGHGKHMAATDVTSLEKRHSHWLKGACFILVNTSKSDSTATHNEDTPHHPS